MGECELVAHHSRIIYILFCYTCLIHPGIKPPSKLAHPDCALQSRKRGQFEWRTLLAKHDSSIYLPNSKMHSPAAVHKASTLKLHPVSAGFLPTNHVAETMDDISLDDAQDAALAEPADHTPNSLEDGIPTFDHGSGVPPTPATSVKVQAFIASEWPKTSGFKVNNDFKETLDYAAQLEGRISRRPMMYVVSVTQALSRTPSAIIRCLPNLKRFRGSSQS